MTTIERWTAVLPVLLMASAAFAAPVRPLEATFGPDGSLTLRDGPRVILTVEPGHAAKGWTGVALTGEPRKPAGGTAGRVRDLASGGALSIDAEVKSAGSGVRLVYEFSITGTLEMESVHASLNLPMA